MSNFFRQGDLREPAPPPAALIHRAAREQTHRALQHVLSSSTHLADEAQVVDFLRFALHRGINLQDLWIAEQQGTILWAVLPLLNPGRTILLLSPGYAPHGAQATEAARQLIESVANHYRDANVHLAQVLLDPQLQAARDLYESCRFERLADLLYLQSTVRNAPSSPPPLPEGFTWHTYSPQMHAMFAQAIAASYQQSLDCPALNGLRSIGDVIAGHRAAGEFDPALWFLLCQHGAPRGVLLLSPSPHISAMELVYLGLAPEARGRGLSDLMMRQAAMVTAHRRLNHLTLAVDAINAPALRLYYRHGMRQVCVKTALMRDLHRAPSSQRAAPAAT